MSEAWYIDHITSWIRYLFLFVRCSVRSTVNCKYVVGIFAYAFTKTATSYIYTYNSHTIHNYAANVSQKYQCILIYNMNNSPFFSIAQTVAWGFAWTLSEKKIHTPQRDFDHQNINKTLCRLMSTHTHTHHTELFAVNELSHSQSVQFGQSNVWQNENTSPTYPCKSYV